MPEDSGHVFGNDAIVASNTFGFDGEASDLFPVSAYSALSRVLVVHTRDFFQVKIGLI